MNFKKFSKILIFVQLFLSLGITALCIEDQSIYKKDILKGNWSIGGDFDTDYSALNGFTYDFEAQLHYFLIDKVSVGTSLSLQNTKLDFSIITFLGFSINYYFFERKRYVFLLGQSFLVEAVERRNSIRVISQSSLGAEYFLSPSVSLGAKVLYNFLVAGDSGFNEFPLLSTRGSFNFYF